jgi:hypothetical protein
LIPVIRNGYFISIAAMLGSALITMSFLQAQSVEAQNMTGDITRSSGGEPFGGEKIGTVSIEASAIHSCPDAAYSLIFKEDMPFQWGS